MIAAKISPPGVEPGTSRLEGGRSVLLSYEPIAGRAALPAPAKNSLEGCRPGDAISRGVRPVYGIIEAAAMKSEPCPTCGKGACRCE